jgi:hypothetical protein
MKKLSIALMSTVLLFVVSGCNSADQSKLTPDELEELRELRETVEELKEEVEEEEAPVEVVVDYTGSNFITMTSPVNRATFTETPIIFTGVTSPNTTKIVVSARGGTIEPGSDGMQVPTHLKYEDVYPLQDFNYGDDEFTYRANIGWNNLAVGSNEYRFEAFFDDGTSQKTDMTIFYAIAGAEMGKPVIYLYPEETMDVFVNVEPNNGISISDPEIGDGWHVTAQPDGTLFVDGNEYPYLFWEGYATDFETPEEGFVVAEANVESFFDATLAYQGMNENEIADFKEFWVPVLTGSPYYFITYIPEATFDTYAPLEVSPAPDSVIRVFFDYKELAEYETVPFQELEQQTRSGFSLIEWGGRLYR